MKVINLKARILLPLALAAVLVLTAFVSGIYMEEQEHLAADLDRSIQAVKGHYRAALEARAHKLGATLKAIAADPVLQSALLARDRDTLFAQSATLFQQLKSKHNITHFYFHDPHRVNIVRVHQPNRYGDTINRFTALGAEKTGTLSHGMELGPLGTFTLRAVLPVEVDDHLLGYIELGEEIDEIIKDIDRVFGVDLFLVIDKQYLNKTDWISGMTMLGRKADWEYFPDRVIVSQTINNLPSNLITLLTASHLPAGDIELNHNDQRFRGRVVPLRDAGKRIVGGLVLLRNMTARIHSTRNTVFMISAGAFTLGLGLFLFFQAILGRTEQQLQQLISGLSESRSHLSNAQRMTHLGNWEWDILHNQVQCSIETAHIFGVKASKCPGRYEQLLDYIHSDDRNEFNDFINKVRNDGGIHELVHRIVRPDGGERIVRHRAEVVHNAAGEVQCVNAAVHDITEWQQAEMLAARMGRVLEHSWNEIYTFDAESHRFIEVSDGARQNLGYSMEELRQLTPLDLKPKFTRKQFEALIGPLYSGEKQQISFEAEHCRKDGSLYPVEVRLQLSRIDKPPVFIAIIQDISERKRYIEELEHKALYDNLTDLPNRNLLQDRLKHMLKVVRRESTPLAVLVMDVLRLREVNDLLGHQNGDHVLLQVARRLQQGLRESDTVARLGGDEFAVILPGMDINNAHAITVKIQKLFEQPVIIDETPLEVETAMGIAFYPDHGDTPELLVQHADIAMRVAKNETRIFSIYNPTDDPFSVRRLKLHGELRKAINEKTLAVHYQPKIDIHTGNIIGVEALARWPHPTEGMISPADFIPMVEQSGLIRPFTLWVLEQAITQSRDWSEAGIDLTVAVNLSTRNLLDPSLADSIAQLLETHKVPPDRLTLEITESAVMSRPEYALKMLTRLHAMGLKLSIDDFGTGYSSLAYLKRLPVAELKIDSSFISGIKTNESDAVIVRSTIDLAHNLGLGVVAEGVEDEETLDLLTTFHCNTAQGYYYSRPVPTDELSDWLTVSSLELTRHTGHSGS